ncbi:MAG TPA: molybdenum cofactor biosynthesis protein MoaE, partial [Rhodanobacteraceae bacterium]|nr:molybdenum cofactor biosynthesis protein MoaE [Rhodanobacteraceae bacterium]
MQMKTFALSATPIDPDALLRTIEGHGIGAVVTFEGRVRDHNEGRAVSGLAYQAYAELAEDEGTKITEEARSRFGVAQVLCVHRVGELDIGELAVWVGAGAAHRDAAFSACRYVIDEVKKRVPIWKR